MVEKSNRYELNTSELYKELGVLTKDKGRWEENIPYVASLLGHETEKIKAKALWLLGEMGLEHPDKVKDTVPEIASFFDSSSPLLRERAVNAIGRIGRADHHLIEEYWAGLFRFTSDEEPKVRLSFIWASENIATNAPELYEEHMAVFEKLLHDEDDKVRMEAPEIFRVLGKRRPEFVMPYIRQLREMSETDSNRVVRIHSLGAIKATGEIKHRKPQKRRNRCNNRSRQGEKCIENRKKGKIDAITGFSMQCMQKTGRKHVKKWDAL